MMLSDVIRQFEGAKRSLPAAMAEAHNLTFADFEKHFPRVALDALMATTESTQREAVQRFVNTFAAANAGVLMSFTLERPRLDQGNENRPITAADVEAWVRAGSVNFSDDNTEGKVFDERDGDVDDVVRKMQGILIFEPNPKGSQAAARDKYLPFIRAFLDQGGVSVETLRNWSNIVIHAWLSYADLTWPDIAMERIDRLFN